MYVMNVIGTWECWCLLQVYRKLEPQNCEQNGGLDRQGPNRLQSTKGLIRARVILVNPSFRLNTNKSYWLTEGSLLFQELLSELKKFNNTNDEVAKGMVGMWVNSSDFSLKVI